MHPPYLTDLNGIFELLVASLEYPLGVGVQVDPSETRTLKGMDFQLVETERFQPRVNQMSTCTPPYLGVKLRQALVEHTLAHRPVRKKKYNGGGA